MNAQSTSPDASQVGGGETTWTTPSVVSVENESMSESPFMTPFICTMIAITVFGLLLGVVAVVFFCRDQRVKARQPLGAIDEVQMDAVNDKPDKTNNV